MNLISPQNVRMLAKLLGYNFYKIFGSPKILPSFLTISINDWCNSRCKTCEIWKNSPKDSIRNELSLQEFEKIFETFGNLYWITITGGEPFLRKDLVPIVRLIYEKTTPSYVTIATNGILTNRIVKDVKSILETCSGLRLIVNVSIDGIGAHHDRIRGVKGSYKSARKTVEELKKLKSDRLIIGINTVLSKYNITSFEKIYETLNEDMTPDSFIVELAENRAKLYNMNLNITPRKIDYIKKLTYLMNRESQLEKNKTSEMIKGLRMEYYRNLIVGKSLRNFEGISSGYLMSNGDVWLSYSKKLIAGNLRESNYNFRKIWFSNHSSKLRAGMEREYSTLISNAFYVNFLCDIRNWYKLLIKFVKN